MGALGSSHAPIGMKGSWQSVQLEAITISVIDPRRNEADYAVAQALRDRTINVPYGFPREAKQESRRRDYTETTVILGAYIMEKLVGTLRIVQKDPDVPDTIEMERVAVDPERQGQGIGRRLVADAESLAVAAGYEKMALFALPSAVSFYERLGYSQTSEVETYQHPVTLEVTSYPGMVKTLKLESE